MLFRSITIDRNELEDARWFSRSEMQALIAREHPEGLISPHPFAIAYHVIVQWLNENGN